MFLHSQLVEHGVGLSDINDTRALHILLIPLLIEVCRQVVLVVLAFEVAELLNDESGGLKGLLLLDHADAIRAVLSELLEQVLKILIVLSGVQLLLGEAGAVGLGLLHGLLEVHLGERVLELVLLVLLVLRLLLGGTLLLGRVLGALNVCLMLLFLVVPVHDGIDLVDFLGRGGCVLTFIIVTSEQAAKILGLLGGLRVHSDGLSAGEGTEQEYCGQKSHNYNRP